MARPSHFIAALSIVWLSLAGTMAQAQAGTGGSPWYGRWTISEDRPVFSPRGLEYKTIDIAPCGKDFCGVSVGANGHCGPALFRFRGLHKDGATSLRGHGKWGGAVRNIVIDTWRAPNDTAPVLNLKLGDGYDLGGRDGNMPKFSGNYRLDGRASCTAR